MTSSPYAPYVQGYTHATMVGTEGCQPARGSQSHKADLSSDCRLQLACMKTELLVTAGQHTAVNMFPGLVHTAHHTMGAWGLKPLGEPVEGRRCRGSIA